MDELELTNLFVSLVGSMPEDLDEAVRLIKEQCRDSARTVVDEWSRTEPLESANAAYVAGQLYEVTLDELLSRANLVSPELRVKFMTTVVDALLQLRLLILEQLELALDNYAPLDSATGGRVCDAAFSLIQRMKQENKSASSEGTIAGLALSQRDEQILNYKQEREKDQSKLDEDF